MAEPDKRLKGDFLLHSPKHQKETNYLFIDGHAVAFHSWFTSYPNSVIPGFMSMVNKVIDEHRPSGVVVAFDPPPPTFRHELYPRYKANRPEPPDEFLDECYVLERRLRISGVPVCKVEGFEADDVIGTLTSETSSRGIGSLVYTCDLDLLQIVDVNTQVSVFSQHWPTRTFDLESAKTRFNGLDPINIPDLKALMGDRSDNLPGVTGIGEKSATVILNATGDIETLYQDLDQVLCLPVRGAKRVRQLLLDHKDDAFLMKHLATIVRDVPLGIDLPLENREPSDLKLSVK